MENAQPGKYKTGNCTPWKMTKNPAQEIDSKCSRNLPEWKMQTLENARMEIVPPRK